VGQNGGKVRPKAQKNYPKIKSLLYRIREIDKI
jgi:hypothetical protein